MKVTLRRLQEICHSLQEKELGQIDRINDCKEKAIRFIADVHAAEKVLEPLRDLDPANPQRTDAIFRWEAKRKEWILRFEIEITPELEEITKALIIEVERSATSAGGDRLVSFNTGRSLMSQVTGALETVTKSGILVDVVRSILVAAG